MTSRVGDFLSEPEPLNQLQRFLEAAETPMVVDAYDLEFVLLPARRDPENEASARQDVEQRRLLRHMGRLEERQQEHACADMHAVGIGDQARERLERRQPDGRAVGEVMADGDAVVTEFPGEAYLLEMLVELLRNVVARRVLGIDEQREIHGHPLKDRRGARNSQSLVHTWSHDA